MDKYYTPTSVCELFTFIISERYVYGKTKDSDLVKLVFPDPIETSIHTFIESCGNKDGLLYNVDLNNYVIPYITKEDIESCGLIFKEEMTINKKLYGIRYTFTMPNPYFELDYAPDKNKVYIGNTETYDDHKCLFNGTINNKSEFKQLLKQLVI